MAHTLFLPATSLPTFCPSSPDPTPLRLLAFSVAEAALQSDPNSPSINMAIGKMPTPPEMMSDASDAWPKVFGGEDNWESFGAWENRSERITGSATTTPQRRRPLWDVVERAKERRDKDASPSTTDSSLPRSPPISPTAYNFMLPAHSPLAKSIEARSTLSLNMSVTNKFPLFTRSAEPSPIDSTFSGLDQTRPPPEFVPRLSASEFSARATKTAASVRHTRTKSDVPPPANNSEKCLSDKLRSQAKFPVQPSRHTAKLPSLAQIQAKMSSPHRRVATVGGVPGAKGDALFRPRLSRGVRSDSEDSIEVLKTPTDEMPPSNPRIVLASILNRRSPSPSAPSPTKQEKGPRLAPFLRERTSGRLSGSGARPMSLPPMNISFEDILKANSKPSLRVTPPKERHVNPTVSVPSPTKGSFPWLSAGNGYTTPTESRFNLGVASTPPHSASSAPRRSMTSPASPTGSIRSNVTASPTLSVPIITCTPAPQKVLRDGVEHESDEEEDEVVVFDGEAEEAKEREEREKRAAAMKARLNLRRRSD